MLAGFALEIYTQFPPPGQLSDLEMVISLHRVALGALSTQHPKRFHVLSNFACFLEERFKKTGQPADLEERISLLREVLGLRPAHPSHGFLSIHRVFAV